MLVGFPSLLATFTVIAHHVAGLGRGASKDVDDLGTGGAAAGLELVAVRRLTCLESGDAGTNDFNGSRGGKSNGQRNKAEELHVGC